MGARSSQPRSPNLNKTDGHLLEYFRNTFGAGGGGTNPSTPGGMVATGGVISEYSDSGTVYRSHIFTASGAFQVTAAAEGFPNTVDILSVGGGGGGGRNPPSYAGSGGGAGGVHYRTGIPASVATYPITIGAGGELVLMVGLHHHHWHHLLLPVVVVGLAKVLVTGGLVLLLVVRHMADLVVRTLVLLDTLVVLMLYLQHQMLMVGVVEETRQILLDIMVMVQVVVEQVE